MARRCLRFAVSAVLQLRPVFSSALWGRLFRDLEQRRLIMYKVLPLWRSFRLSEVLEFSLNGEPPLARCLVALPSWSRSLWFGWRPPGWATCTTFRPLLNQFSPFFQQLSTLQFMSDQRDADFPRRSKAGV